VERATAIKGLKWLAYAVLAVVALRWYQTSRWPSTELAPLAATTLAGKSVTLPDERPVILHFWATWCGICELEQDSIAALAKDARLVSVASLSGSRRDVQRYLDAHALEFDVIHDPRGELANRYGVSAYPTTLFIDADGDILAREVGYVTSLGLRLRWWLAQ
jgi:thiol-disulfide isomerase/thioredoxin